MLRITAKFKENFWDVKANSEVPMGSVYLAEALSVESQKDGMNIQQKFNGHNYGMFLKYKDLESLQIDDATIEDFKDLEAIEAVVANANSVKKLTFIGDIGLVKVSEDASEDPGELEDIVITKEWQDKTDKVLYMVPVEDSKDEDGNEFSYEIAEITAENAEVMVQKVEIVTKSEEEGVEDTVEEMLQVTVRGIRGNVVMDIKVRAIKKDEEKPDPDPSGSSSSDSSSSSSGSSGSSTSEGSDSSGSDGSGSSGSDGSDSSTPESSSPDSGSSTPEPNT